MLTLLAGMLAAATAGAQDPAGPAAPARPDSRVTAPARPGPSPGSAALRSLVLPGWGQAANRAWLKSAGFLGAYGGLLAWAVSLNQDKMDAVGRLNAAESAEDIAFWTLEVDRFDNDRNAKYWLMGLTTLLSMVDAYVDAHLKGFDRRMDAEVGCLPSAEGGVAGACLTLSWDAPLQRPQGDRAR